MCGTPWLETPTAERPARVVAVPTDVTIVIIIIIVIIVMIIIVILIITIVRAIFK